MSLHGHVGVHFSVKGWSPKIDMDIFEEPKNHRVFLDHKVWKKINFSESRLYMDMQGCILMLRVGAQNRYSHIWRAQKKPKILIRFNFWSAYFLKRGLFFWTQGWFLIIGFRWFLEPKKDQNSGAVYLYLYFIFMYLVWKRCVWEIIDEEDIYCARLAQLSTTFLFSK